MTISLRATDISSRRTLGLVGARVYSQPSDEVRSFANSVPQAKQVMSLTVSGAAATGTVYVFSINGFELSYTRIAGDATDSDVAAKIALVINQDLRVRGQVSAMAVGAVVTVTANLPGMSFSTAESHANLAWALVSASVYADSIPFGRLVCSLLRGEEGEKLGFVAKSSLLSAQVDSYALVYEASVELKMKVVVDGQEFEASHEMAAASDIDTQGPLAAAKMNAVLPPNSVLVAYVAASDSMSFSSEVPGKAFFSAMSLGSGATVAFPAKSSVAGPSTDINKAAAGISEHTYDEESTSYPANAGFKATEKGDVWVANSEGVGSGDPVYVELADGADSGKLFKTSSATRALLAGGKWERASLADGIAHVSISLK